MDVEITEKCNFAKSPQITDAIKFLAFDEWVSDYPDVKTLKLISTNVELQGCIKNWCEEKKSISNGHDQK